MPTDEVINRDQLVDQLHRLGVKPGSVLVVHSSYRAIRPVEGGPSGVIEALLEAIGPEGTLVMPSMTDWDDDQVFEPNVTPCLGMGIIADTFWRRPGVLRSDSPHSFAAHGPAFSLEGCSCETDACDNRDALSNHGLDGRCG